MLERKGKVDAAELQELVGKKKTNAEIAKHFGVSRPAITQAIKRLNREIAGEVLSTPAKVERAANAGLKMAERYQAIAEAADDVLREARKGGGPWSRKTVLDACKVIREQLEFQARMIEMLHDFNTVQEFQQEVMSVIGEAAPDVRAEIQRRLQERRTLRFSLVRPEMGNK